MTLLRLNAPELNELLSFSPAGLLCFKGNTACFVPQKTLIYNSIMTSTICQTSQHNALVWWRAT